MVDRNTQKTLKQKRASTNRQARRDSTPLRLALLAGGLTHGGAEKQLVYMAQSLRQVGIDARVYGLTQGDYYQSHLVAAGVPYHWVGEPASPLARIANMLRVLRPFRPHIIQSTHFFTNLYAAILGRLMGTVNIGSVRSSVYREVKSNGRWGPYLLRAPQALILNSETARQNALPSGVPAQRLFVLPNMIDLQAFDRSAASHPVNIRKSGAFTVITVARLVKAKRLERFLAALAKARQANPKVRGVLVGEGPLGEYLQDTAAQIGLLPDGVTFLGLRSDIPALLSEADLFVLSSETEGFPNAILEAMAACLPVITTPAGEATQVVRHEVTGYVVKHDDTEAMAARILELAASPERRSKMGAAGRKHVSDHYSIAALPGRLLSIYRDIAGLQGSLPALRALAAISE